MTQFDNMTIMSPLPYTMVVASNVTGFQNLLTPQPGERAQKSSIGDMTLRVDLGAVKAVRQIALLYTDLLYSDRLVVRASDTNFATYTPPDLAWTTPELPGLASVQGDDRPAGYRHFLCNIPCHLRFRYWEIVVLGATMRSFGVLALGPTFTMLHNPDFGGTEWGYAEGDDPELLDGGAEVLRNNIPAPEMTFTASWGTQKEMDRDWDKLGRMQHEGKPVLLTRRPDPHSERHNGIYWGRLIAKPMVAADFDMFETNGRVRSMV